MMKHKDSQLDQIKKENEKLRHVLSEAGFAGDLQNFRSQELRGAQANNFVLNKKTEEPKPDVVMV